MPRPPLPNLLIAIDSEFERIPGTAFNTILSYQACAVNRDTGLTRDFIQHVWPDRRGKSHRITLPDFIGLVLRDALHAGVIATHPRSITLAFHFARVDLSMFVDFHTRLKRRLNAVRGTYITTTRRLMLEIPTEAGKRRMSFAIIDTTLLAPEKKKSLAELGRQVGLEKFEIPSNYSIAEMARYRKEQSEAYNAYALRDAQITAQYACSIYDQFKAFGIPGGPPTIGAAGSAMFRRQFPTKADLHAFLGKGIPCAAMAMKLAAGAYHGGMNSIYYLGYSPFGRVVTDVDIRAAYTTSLSAISWPDWTSARYTKLLVDLAVIDQAMTFSLVEFKFPPAAKFPCLPVRSRHKHGLIYPLEGEAWACGPELVAAQTMGAVITVREGYRIDWIPGRGHPFADYSQRIAKGRAEAEAAGDDLMGLAFKLLGNVLYGKASQGVSSQRPLADDVEDHRVFNAAIGEMVDLPPSSITCSAFAAYSTSLVRALLFETLHRLPSSSIALMATTDGILFCGDESDIDVTGPIAQAFKRARARVTGEQDPKIWDVKFTLPRVLCFKTRGAISIVPADWTGKVHLAKAGAHFPDHLTSDVEQSRYAEQLYRSRDYDTQYTRKNLTPLSKQHELGCDVTEEIVNVQLSWEFDWKNKPIEPVVDSEGLISFGTRPWPTIQVFEEHRKNFDEWRHHEHRVLKTVRDYVDLVEWIALRSTRKALRTNARGVLPNLARAVVAEHLRRSLRERKTYQEIAQSLSSATPYFVSVSMIQNIRRKRNLIDKRCVFHLSADDIVFARGYSSNGTNPITIGQLREFIIPGSVAERQFGEIWERRLPAPALALTYSAEILPFRQKAEPVHKPDPAPEADYAAIFSERFALLKRNVDWAEARLRAIEHTINVYRRDTAADFESAKAAVLAAISRKSNQEKTAP